MQHLQDIQNQYETLIGRANEPGENNGIFTRWQRPVLTRNHVPPMWMYDLDPQSDPLGLQRLGVNAVFNSGALHKDGVYYLVARVEGHDRKSFFALAKSDKSTEGFRFVCPIELPDTCSEEVNVYDMRLTEHEDGWIYGTFCSESKDPGNADPSAALAACAIVRTKDLLNWQRLPNLKSKSSQQRNVVLHPEFVDGKYAFYTRPQDGFIDAGSGGGICFGLSDTIENAEVGDERVVSPRRYHQITESKNGAGAVPIKTEHGWLHIAHGVRNTAAGLRYVLYVIMTDLAEPWRVTHEPSGFFIAPQGNERVGDVSNVVFCNGAALNEKGELAIYYASSDTRLHVATTTLERLIDYTLHTPRDPGRSPDCVKQRKALISRNEAYLECQRWLQHVPSASRWRAELEQIAHDEPKRTDAFYRDLAFGTGGLRAEIGAGSNRMNHFVVGRATQGLANYIKKAHADEQLKACVAYDTRYCSQEFAQHAAQILQGNGFTVYLFAQPRPTPMLSFAVRHFGAQTGIVITASHNPREYNGYKAYNSTGGQLTDEAAGLVLNEINKLDYFVPMAMGQGALVQLDESFDEIYYAAAENFLQKPADGDALKLLYTPLHGTGLVPVTGLLERLGYSNVDVVPSQKYQDKGCTFPTVAKPNPEDRCVFEPAMEIAKTSRPDVIFATDPDADRIGVLVQNGDEYEVLTGNQTGALLVDYLIARAGLSANPGMVSTIVTGTLAERICRANNVAMELVLTGFKYIGEVMDEWEVNGKHDFLFGFEESYGYLLGDHCRDKDGVISAALVAEMALFYKRKGQSLYTALQELYAKYGPVADLLYNHEAKGAAGAAQIGAWMLHIRKHFATCLPSETVVAMEDYQAQQTRDLRTGETVAIALPKSNVMKLHLADGSWLVLRPSGTEPKIKLYICTNDAFKPGDSLAAAQQRADEILAKAMQIFA